MTTSRGTSGVIVNAQARTEGHKVHFDVAPRHRAGPSKHA